MEELYKKLKEAAQYDKISEDLGELCILNNTVSAEDIKEYRIKEVKVVKNGYVDIFTLELYNSSTTKTIRLKNIFYSATITNINHLNEVYNWYGKIIILISSMYGYDNIEEIVEFIQTKNYELGRVVVYPIEYREVKILLDFAISSNYDNSIFACFSFLKDEEVLNDIIDEYHGNTEIDKLYNLLDRLDPRIVGTKPVKKLCKILAIPPKKC